MKMLKAGYFFKTSAPILAFILLGTCPSFSKDGKDHGKVTDGIYMELTRDFYESLRDIEMGENRVYSNDPSIEYLKEINVSTRFMVETNLQILKQQERILQLLESLLEEKNK